MFHKTILQERPGSWAIRGVWKMLISPDSRLHSSKSVFSLSTNAFPSVGAFSFIRTGLALAFAHAPVSPLSSRFRVYFETVLDRQKRCESRRGSLFTPRTSSLGGTSGTWPCTWPSPELDVAPRLFARPEDAFRRPQLLHRCPSVPESALRSHTALHCHS